MQQIKEIEEMSYKELRTEVRRISDELTKFKRLYEDAIEHLTLSNFDGKFVKEYDGLKTEITAAAGLVKSRVSKVDLEKALEQYSTIEQTAEKIKSEVSEAGKNYATKTEVTQTADSIYMLVASNADLSNAKEIKSLTYLEDCDTDKVYKYIRNADEDNEEEVYYQYNHIIEDWQIIDGTIYTVFKQTEDGFHMRGNVKISGDLITGGKITGTALESRDRATNTVLIQNGYLYLIPERGDDDDDEATPSVRFGMIEESGYYCPLLIFGAGTGSGGMSINGQHTYIRGAMHFLKDTNGFQMSFVPSNGGVPQLIRFNDSTSSSDAYISFGAGTVVKGLKITFG